MLAAVHKTFAVLLVDRKQGTFIVVIDHCNEECLRTSSNEMNCNPHSKVLDLQSRKIGEIRWLKLRRQHEHRRILHKAYKSTRKKERISFSGAYACPLFTNVMLISQVGNYLFH